MKYVHTYVGVVLLQECPVAIKQAAAHLPYFMQKLIKMDGTYSRLWCGCYSISVYSMYVCHWHLCYIRTDL